MVKNIVLNVSLQTSSARYFIEAGERSPEDKLSLAHRLKLEVSFP